MVLTRFWERWFPVSRWPFLAGAIGTVLRLWLVAGQTLSVFAEAKHDSALFARQAWNLLRTGWLGPYDELTLVKGFFYPAWIAVMHLVHIPLGLSHHLVYVLACILFILALRPLSLNPWYLLAGYLLLLFNPMSLTSVMASIIREGIYPAQTLLVLACPLGLLVRYHVHRQWSWAWSAGAGLSLASFWLTREEGIWLLPSFLLLMGGAAWLGVRDLRSRPWQDWVRPTVIWLLPFVIWGAAMAGVAWKNATAYGIWSVTDVKAPGYASAYRALTSVRPQVPDRRFPVTIDARLKAYAVSPAFAELAPVLEGRLGRNWALTSNSAWGFPADQPETTHGYFFWALREAAASRGYYASGRTAEDYYRRVAAELREACRQKRLECRHILSAYLPVWDTALLKDMVITLAKGLSFTLTWQGFQPLPAPSTGDPSVFPAYAELTRSRLTPAFFQGAAILAGWAVSPQGPLTLTGSTVDGRPVSLAWVPLTSPDIRDHMRTAYHLDLPHAGLSRFLILADIQAPSQLHFTLNSSRLRSIPMDGTVTALIEPSLYFHLDRFEAISGDNSWPFLSRQTLVTKILRALGGIYAVVFPALSAAAFLIMALGWVRMVRRLRWSLQDIASLALFAGFFLRLLLVVLLHLTSVPAIEPRYLAPLYPLGLAWVLVVLVPWGAPACKKPVSAISDQGAC